jgi:hypothetical protein
LAGGRFSNFNANPETAPAPFEQRILISAPPYSGGGVERQLVVLLVGALTVTSSTTTGGASPLLRADRHGQCQRQSDKRCIDSWVAGDPPLSGKRNLSQKLKIP